MTKLLVMPPLKPLTVIHADDHNIFRTGFKRIMEIKANHSIQFAEDATDGMDLFEKVKRHRPDVVLTDIKMPNIGGIEACRLIKASYPHTGVIAFSALDSEQSIFDMLNAGADGYLVKNTTCEEVLEAITTVKSGTPYYCSTVSEKIYGSFSTLRKPASKHSSFSVQEINIIKLICKQYSTKEISLSLRLAVRTVEDYRQKLLEKIGAKNVVGIALYAIINGIIQAGDL